MKPMLVNPQKPCRNTNRRLGVNPIGIYFGIEMAVWSCLLGQLEYI